MMSGEYFLTKDEKEKKKKDEINAKREVKKQEKIQTKNQMFEAPEEDMPQLSNTHKKKRDKKAEEKDIQVKSKPDINELKNKFLKKK